MRRRAARRAWAAKDCLGGGARSPAPLPELALEDLGAGGPGSSGALLSDLLPGPGQGSGGSGSIPGFLPDAAGSAPGLMPGGVVPGMAGSMGSRFGADGSLPGSAGSGSGTGGGPRGAAGAQSGPEPAARSRGFGTEPGLDPEEAANLGSFPGARGGGTDPSAGTGGGGSRRGGMGRSGSDQLSGAEGLQAGEGSQISIRIALPESIRREAQAGGEAGVPALETMFGIILHYLGELQHSLDTGGTPSRQIDGFAERILHAFREPPSITDAERRIARDLALKFALLPHLGSRTFRPDPLEIRTAPPGSEADAVLVIEPNRLNDAVGVDRGGNREGGAVNGGVKRPGERRRTGGPAGSTRAGEAHRSGTRGSGAQGDMRQEGMPSARGRAAIALNAYPGIWKGLEIRIEPYSVLLLPPEVREPERMRWRTVAYIAPALDDFVVGFVFAGVDAAGRLRIQADANRVRLRGRPLFTEYRESAFGSRGWLVSLYAALAAGLLLLGVGWRLLARIAGRTA